MGKLIIVSGANNSGKSRYAEQLAAQAGEARVYIATMIPQTTENRLRIAKHIRQRAGLHFQTLELPYRVGDAPLDGYSAVLLEDVSNLLSNVVFCKQGSRDEVFADICRLQARCAALVAVTISGLEAGAYTGETAAYIESLNWLNERLSARADTVVRMKDGVPYLLKGGPARC